MSYSRSEAAAGRDMLSPKDIERMWGGDTVVWVGADHPARQKEAYVRMRPGRVFVVHPGWNALSFGAALASRKPGRGVPDADLKNLRLARATIPDGEPVAVDLDSGVAHPKALVLAPIYECNLCYCLSRCRGGPFQPPWPWGHSFGLVHDRGELCSLSRR